MLVCAACGFHNAEEAVTCSSCGTDLGLARQRICPTCGTLNSIRDLFCIQCLTLLPPALSQLDTLQTDIETVTEPRDPLAALTQSLPEAQLDFNVVPAPLIPAVRAVQHAFNTQPGSNAGTSGHDSDTRSSFSRVHRIFLFLLILAAGLTAVFVRWTPAPGITPRASAAALTDALASLPDNAVILLSFDYGPAYVAELDALAGVALRTLNQKSARLLVMSIYPLGMSSAERVLANEFSGAVYGDDWLYLGYLPAGEMGLRLLVRETGSAFVRDYRFQQPLGVYPLAQELDFRRIQRVIVISDNALTIKQWLEQVHSQTGLPLDALVSAGAEPLLVPYRDAEQLSSLTGGLPAALEYEAALKDAPPSWGFSAGLSGFILIFILAVIFANRRVPPHGHQE